MEMIERKNSELTNKKDHNMEIIQKSLYDILFLVEGLSEIVCTNIGNTDLMRFVEEQIYEIKRKIKEINTDATI